MTEERFPGGARLVAVAALSAAVAASACASGDRRGQRVPAVTPRPASAPVTASLEQRDVRLQELLQRASSSRTAAALAAAAYRYYELGVRDQALDYFSASLSLDRAFVPALDGKARVWRDAGHADLALTSAHTAIYFAPRSAEAWNTLGTILQSLNRPDDAARAYRRAIDLDAGAAYARNNLCYLSILRDARAAAPQCRAASEANPGFVPAIHNLALAYAAAGDVDRAFATFAAASGEAVAHYNMGIVWMAERRYEDAVGAFETAYHIDPDFDRAWARAREARRMNLQSETLNDSHRR